MPEKQFISSRARSAALLLISVAFVAIAVLLPNSSDIAEFWRVGAAVFFGLGVLVFAVQIVRPQRLILDSEGISCAGGLIWSPKKTRWTDIEPLFVHRLPRGGAMIGFNYKTGARDRGLLLKFNRRAAGADGIFPMHSRVPPETLVDELNDYRKRALEGHAPSARDRAHP